MELSEQEAKEFFIEFFHGEHHFPSTMKPFGSGWCINSKRNLSTYDGDDLTRLVFMAHNHAFRVELQSAGIAGIKIIIHKRQREGRLFERHPTIEQAIQRETRV